VLADSGDAVWMEEPGFRGIHATLAAADCVPVPVPVDDEGCRLPRASAWHRGAADLHLAVPSISGVTMSLARRLELLAYARRVRAWVLEDDYDSEFAIAAGRWRRCGGLDESGLVLYGGSFSRRCFGRCGSAIWWCLKRWRKPSAVLAPLSTTIRAGLAAGLAAFMEGGYFGQPCAADAAPLCRTAGGAGGRRARALAGVAGGGARSRGVASDRAAGARAGEPHERPGDRTRRRCGRRGDGSLSGFYARRPAQQGLLLGYGAFEESEIHSAVGRLATVLRAAGQEPRDRVKQQRR
jgi:GntR family transcriptional regulator/MocR family aminotransferase